MKITAIIIAAIIVLLVLLVVLAWLGLRVKPKPLPPYGEQTPTLSTVPLPADLPAPVSRFYDTISGNQIPPVESGPRRQRPA